MIAANTTGQPIASSSKVTLDCLQSDAIATTPAEEVIVVDDSDSESAEEAVKPRVDLSRFKYGAPAVAKVATSRASLLASETRAASALPAPGAIRQYVKKAGGKGKAVAIPECPIEKQLMKEIVACVVCGTEWAGRKLTKTKWVCGKTTQVNAEVSANIHYIVTYV
jgi:hypothetical protein